MIRNLAAACVAPQPFDSADPRSIERVEWTDELEGQLRALWGAGHSAAEIGRRLGFSKHAIVAKKSRIHLAGRPSPIKRGQVPAPRATIIHPDRLAAGLAPLPAFHPIAMERTA